jgi:hypothetical protein
VRRSRSSSLNSLIIKALMLALLVLGTMGRPRSNPAAVSASAIDLTGIAVIHQVTN